MIRRVRRETPEYAEFARLHRLACTMVPGGSSGWNGDLYTFDRGPWGGYDTETGRMLMSRSLVLDHLSSSAPASSAPASSAPASSAEALATIYHESVHACADPVTDHPNGVFTRATLVLDEALVERRTAADLAVFAHRAGYPGITSGTVEYSSAVAAADHILEYAAGPEGADALNRDALNGPVPLQWDTIADAVLDRHLPDTVPPWQEVSARSSLITALTGAAWDDLHDRPVSAGTVVAGSALSQVETALAELRRQPRYAEEQVDLARRTAFRGMPMPTALKGGTTRGQQDRGRGQPTFSCPRPGYDESSISR